MLPSLLLPITTLPDLRLLLVVGSARQDLLFFARCLAPLAGVVANSAPAAAAWYDLLNAKTLLGTGLPKHPWVGGTDSSDFRPVVDATRGTFAFGRFGEILGNVEGHNSAASQGGGNHDDEAALFLAMALAADKDEWSAVLVGAGLVRSLMNSLQACLDFRTAMRGLDSTKASAAAGRSGSFRWATQPLPGEVASGGAESVKDVKAGDVRGEVVSDGCLGRELETAQVLVVVALGALLSAHPLAARDRFQLSGGMLRVHRVIFQQPKHSRAEEMRESVLSRGEGCNATASTLTLPFLQEHCALVALQVLRLCLRADDEAKQLPTDVLEGAVRLVGALAPSMRMAWEKSHVTGAGLACGPPHVGLADGGESFQPGGAEIGGDGCDRLGGLSYRFLPLGLLEEVSASDSAGVPSPSESTGPAADAKPPLDASSYRLCG